MGTRTSIFGVSGREGHCSKKFYSSKKYKSNNSPRKSVKVIENKIDVSKLDKLYRASSEDMGQLPDNSIHLMVTSPPYNVGKEYDDDLSIDCLLYTSPSPRDRTRSRMPSSA